MPRHVLSESQIHPAIRKKLASDRHEIIDEVIAAVDQNDILVVGMAQNPFPRRAKKTLDAHKLNYKYLEYGSYFSDWRRRTALKMWTGWGTFPMIFVKGIFIGGAEDLEALIKSGELDQLLKAERTATSADRAIFAGQVAPTS